MLEAAKPGGRPEVEEALSPLRKLLVGPLNRFVAGTARYARSTFSLRR